MHTLIHRALSPQTISYAWLVLTVALTFALAVAQSAIAAGPSLSAAGLPAPTSPSSVRLRPRARRPVPCGGAAEDQRAGAPPWAPGATRRARALGASAGPAAAGAGVLTPFTPYLGADALAAPVRRRRSARPSRLGRLPDELPGRSTPFASDLDLDFSLSHHRSAASGPSVPAVEGLASLMPVIGTPA